MRVCSLNVPVQKRCAYSNLCSDHTIYKLVDISVSLLLDHELLAGYDNAINHV